MMKREAEWAGKTIYEMPTGKVFPMLNLGSSSESFRMTVQPYIDHFLFRPAREMQLRVLHADAKDENGVDLVGNLLDPEFRSRLLAIGARSVLAMNLLEHLPDPVKGAEYISNIVPANGYLLVTVPHKYPKHEDPFDNMYRPTPQILCESFRSFRVVDQRILNCGTMLQRHLENPFAAARTFIRLCLPFYKPKAWLNSMRYQTYLFRPFLVTCVLLQKMSSS